jgi:vacuolar protein sorting-associated protein 41
VYTQILLTMLKQAEEMKEKSATDISRRLVAEAEDQFLYTLVAWGTTNVLNEFQADLLPYQCDLDTSFTSSMENVVASSKRRREQTAAGYLNFRGTQVSTMTEGGRNVPGSSLNDTQDSLFDVDNFAQVIGARISLAMPHLSEDVPLITGKIEEALNSRVALDAAAKLSMMKGLFNDALRYLLVIGALHSASTIEDVEKSALSAVSRLEEDAFDSPVQKQSQYIYIVRLIEKHHLHQCLLDIYFLSGNFDIPPLFSLVKLVGLDLFGEFLLSHCAAPQSERPSSSIPSGDQRGGTLPLDIVAAQLEASPQLLHWYLHLLFVRKPELYVRFPNTASPPAVITNLHRKHLDLHIKYAGVNRDSTKVLEGLETYRIPDRSTPLLLFLKVRSYKGISFVYVPLLTVSSFVCEGSSTSRGDEPD